MRCADVLLTLLLVSLPSAHVSLSSQAHAWAPRDAARERAGRGYRAYKKARYQEAKDHFLAAEKSFHAPTFLLWLARSHDKLGELLAAEEVYAQLLDEKLAAGSSPKFHTAQVDAFRELEALKPRVPTVTLVWRGVKSGDAIVTIDDETVDPGQDDAPLRIDPGHHALRVTTAGETLLEDTRSWQEGESETFVVRPATKAADDAPGPSPEGTDLLVPAIVAFSAAGAAAILGAVGGALALDRRAQLDDLCFEKMCRSAQQPIGDEMNAFATVSTIGFVIAGVAAATGTVLIALHDEQPERASVSVGVGPLSLWLSGSF